VGLSSSTNEAPTANGPTSHHPLNLGKFEGCPGNGVLWLCLLEIRWQINALAAGNFGHTDGINQCLTACPTRRARSRHYPELRHRFPTDELAAKAALQSPEC